MFVMFIEVLFDDFSWVFEDKYDGFWMIVEIWWGKVVFYSCNGKIISCSYIEVVKVLEGVKGDVVIDGEFVVIGKDGVLYF